MTRQLNIRFSLLIVKGIVLAAMLLTSVGTMAQDKVDALLSQFDQQPTATIANQFFSELEKADFTGQTIAFPENTPHDSLQQQVWYWAAEWLYDQQQYKRAEQYGQISLSGRQNQENYAKGKDQRNDDF